jgi:hypothetical protein
MQSLDSRYGHVCRAAAAWAQERSSRFQELEQASEQVLDGDHCETMGDSAAAAVPAVPVCEGAADDDYEPKLDDLFAPDRVLVDTQLYERLDSDKREVKEVKTAKLAVAAVRLQLKLRKQKFILLNVFDAEEENLQGLGDRLVEEQAGAGGWDDSLLQVFKGRTESGRKSEQQEVLSAFIFVR